MSTDVEEINDINIVKTENDEDVVDEGQELKVYDDITKWDPKKVTPVIVLSATLFMAIYTYFKHYPIGVWIKILVICVLIFLVIGSIIERMLRRFVDINYEKAVAERREAEKLEEEARAAMEAESDVEGPAIISDEDDQTFM